MISDLDTLKVLADPLRLNILEMLGKPGTVKQVAAKIGRPPTKLYYHFNLLEKHGLLTMVDTRIVSGIVEKHYQTSARTFRLQRDLLSPGADGFNESLDVALNAMFTTAREDLHASVKSGLLRLEDDAPRHRTAFINQARLRLQPDRADEFYERLEALVKEFQADADDHDDDADVDEDSDIQYYKLLLILYPRGRQVIQSDDDQHPDA